MKLEKKRILKEDGRYLVFYHSAATATADQTAVFEAVESAAEPVGAPAKGADRNTPGGAAGSSGAHV